MRASRPANFNSFPKNPPLLESNIVPVRGDFETMTCLPERGARVPVRGPVVKIRIFSGDSGSIFGKIISEYSFTPRPLPPI